MSAHPCRSQENIASDEPGYRLFENLNANIDKTATGLNQAEPECLINSPLGNSTKHPLPSQLATTATETRSIRISDSTQVFKIGTPKQPRRRGLSRSSSVPTLIHRRCEKRTDGTASPKMSTEHDVDDHDCTRHSTSSVKHLTCFWWKEKGFCRFADDDCLYAHYDTGHYTDPPRQLVPGEPALAGRKLDRAMRNLAAAAHRSSGSWGNTAGSRHPSRPSTPVVRPDRGTPCSVSFSSPLTPPPTIALQMRSNADLDMSRLNSDNQFLRNLVDQTSKEKAVMVSTIETLQTDNKGMRGELEGLRKAQEQLLVEREGLHKRIRQLESEQSPNFGNNHTVGNPFGAIGRGRVNTEAHFIGALLKET